MACATKYTCHVSQTFSFLGSLRCGRCSFHFVLCPLECGGLTALHQFPLYGRVTQSHRRSFLLSDCSPSWSIQEVLTIHSEGNCVLPKQKRLSRVLFFLHFCNSVSCPGVSVRLERCPGQSQGGGWNSQSWIRKLDQPGGCLICIYILN